MSQKNTYPYFVSGLILCGLGAVCFSTKVIFVKLAYRETAVDPVTLLTLRMIFSLPFFVISAWWSSSKTENIKFTGRQWFAVAVIGCLGYYVSSLLDFWGLQYVSAGIERLILFIYPTLVLLMSAIVFQVKIKKMQWLALLVSYAGLTIAFWGEIKIVDQAEDFYLGALLVFICAITYAIYIAGSGRLIPSIGASKFNSYAMSFAAIAVVLHFFAVNENSLFDLHPHIYTYSLLMAIFSTVIPSYLIAYGIKRVGSNNAAIIGSIGPVSTLLQAYFFLQEPIHVPQIMGTCFILVGIILIGRK